MLVLVMVAGQPAAVWASLDRIAQNRLAPAANKATLHGHRLALRPRFRRRSTK
jgi:hypothetical protein